MKIENNEYYKKALVEVEELIDDNPKKNSRDYKKMGILLKEISDYESKNYKIGDE